jgi:hypothetical protein
LKARFFRRGRLQDELVTSQIARLDQAKALLSSPAAGMVKRSRGRPKSSPTAALGKSARKKRNLSPEGRAHRGGREAPLGGAEGEAEGKGLGEGQIEVA